MGFYINPGNENFRVIVNDEYMDHDGLGEAAEKLTAGLEVSFETEDFKNDLTSFESSNDVLTLLTHFGYLTY